MALSELGAFLQRHREEQGLTIDEIAERTRIRRGYLEAIEAGEWDLLPPGVFTRGLLNSYAKALGISQASVGRMYISERPSEARHREPQLISQPLVRETRLSFELLLSGAVLLVAVALFGWMVATQILPQVAGLVEPGGTAGADAVGPTAASTAARLATGSTATALPRQTVQPITTSTPSPSPTPSSGIVLDIEANDGDIWLRVQSDESEPFTGFLRDGEARRFEADQRVTVRTGSAGYTKVTLNGREIESLGEPGAVEEFEWRLLEDGNLEQTEL